ncbi:sulfotransferase family cytosolic 2B member 1-like, partial [Clarias magur]
MANSDYLVYNGLLLPKVLHSHDSLKDFESFQLQDDDVIIVTYPKSGTTWMQEILPSLLNGGDPTPVLTIPNWLRVPWLEEVYIAEVIDRLSAPRAFTSHMPYNLMPSSLFSSKAKVIYLRRNPKDVAVSNYYFNQMGSFLPDPGTFEEFTDNFLTGNVIFGKWTDHVKGWRKADLGDRILYVTYEEMFQDVCGVIERLLHFLGRQLSEDALKRVIEQCTFKSMQQNKMSNYTLVPQDSLDQSKVPFLRK